MKARISPEFKVGDRARPTEKEAPEMRNRRAKPADSPSCLAMSRSGQMPEGEAICQQRILSEGHPWQGARAEWTGSGRERRNECGCPARRLSLTNTDDCKAAAFRVDGERGAQVPATGSTRTRAPEYCCPRGLSSEEFFGLHCQMPVQLCCCVVGHLADLFLYEPNGVL